MIIGVGGKLWEAMNVFMAVLVWPGYAYPQLWAVDIKYAQLCTCQLHLNKVTVLKKSILFQDYLTTFASFLSNLFLFEVATDLSEIFFTDSVKIFNFTKNICNMSL